MATERLTMAALAERLAAIEAGHGGRLDAIEAHLADPGPVTAVDPAGDVTAQPVATTPEPLSPGARRVLRTMLQVAVSAAAAVPGGAALLHLSAATTGKVTAVAGALVVLVTAVHNALDPVLPGALKRETVVHS